MSYNIEKEQKVKKGIASVIDAIRSYDPFGDEHEETLLKAYQIYLLTEIVDRLETIADGLEVAVPSLDDVELNLKSIARSVAEIAFPGQIYEGPGQTI